MNMTTANLMSINRFIYPTCTAEIPAKFNGEFFASNPELYKLVVEIAVQFKLSIFRVDADDKFYFCNSETGLMVGFCHIDKSDYCFYSYTTKKAKGSDDVDRCTYRSSKLSYLIAALKKAKFNDYSKNILDFAASATTALHGGLRIIKPPVDIESQAAAHANRFETLDTSEMEELLRVALRESPNSALQSHRVKRFTEALEFYTTKNARVRAVEKEQAKFMSPKVIAVDVFDHLIIADSRSVQNDERLEVSNMQRIPSNRLDEFAPEFSYLFLLLRTQYTDMRHSGPLMGGGAMPVMDHHNRELDVLHYFYTGLTPRLRSYAFMFIGKE